jgi:hypothetical protein
MDNYTRSYGYSGGLNLAVKKTSSMFFQHQCNWLQQTKRSRSLKLERL